MTWQEHRSEAEDQSILENWELAAAHYVEAASLLMQEKRLENAPELAYLQLHAGQSLLHCDQPAAALPILDNALKLATLIEYNELLIPAQTALGEAHAALGDHHAALTLFEAALGERVDAGLYLAIACSQLALGQEDDGLKNLERACKLHFKAKNLGGMVQSVAQAAGAAEQAQYPKLARNLYKKALQLTELWPDSERDTALQAALQGRLDALA